MRADMTRINRIIELTREGKTLREMAEVMGLSDTRIGALRTMAVEKGLFPDYADIASKHRVSWPRVIAMFETGATCSEVAQAFGCSINRVRRWRVEMRRRGQLPKFRAKSMHRRADSMMRMRGGVCGSLKDCLDELPREVITWLVRETPDGAKLSDTVAAIIKDAYYEENPG